MFKSKFRLFAPCYYAFFANGAMVLLVGSILPYLIAEAGISYSIAGSFLSAFAIGNLLASFVFPAVAGTIGRHKAIVCLSALVPISFATIVSIPPVAVIFVAFILAGIGRGSVSIINNAVVSDNTEGKAAPLNLLHMVFAIGAFLAPFFMSLCIGAGLGWKVVVYAIILLSTGSTLGYAWMTIDYDEVRKKGSAAKDFGFLKSVDFYVVALILFAYYGVENCVNGWFVTYFQNMGIMSEELATTMVSITWIMVMLGRLATAALSSKIEKNKLIFVDCILTAVFFVMMISTQNIAVIVCSLAGLGFFMAGLYPTCVSSVGRVLQGNTTGMSIFLAMIALGGIITPQVIGIMADMFDLSGAIATLVINIVVMIVMGMVNVRLAKKTRSVSEQV